MDSIIQQIISQKIDLQSSIHPYTRRQSTAEMGIGFFASEAIEAGVIVAEKKGFIVYEHQLLKMIGEEKLIPDPYSQGSYCQIGKDVYLCGVDKKSVSMSMIGINHSCIPNVGKQDNTRLITMRHIKKGEELTTDYGFQLNNDWFKLQCKCGTAKCRGTITGKDWKLLLDQKNWFAQHLKEALKNELLERI